MSLGQTRCGGCGRYVEFATLPADCSYCRTVITEFGYIVPPRTKRSVRWHLLNGRG
jgi:hypothetical protein